MMQNNRRWVQKPKSARKWRHKQSSWKESKLIFWKCSRRKQSAMLNKILKLSRDKKTKVSAGFSNMAMAGNLTEAVMVRA